MENKNIFEEEIKIPDIVQKKANLAFSQIEEKEETKEMSKKSGYKFLVRAVAMVASVAVAIGGINIAGRYMKDNNIISDDTENKLDNLFTINVMAAELKEGETLPISVDGMSKSWSFGFDDEGNYTYSINLPLTVTGEGIKHITYSINKGALQVVCPLDNNIVVDGEKCDMDKAVVKIGGGYDNEGHFICETFTEHYKSFTLDYDKQQGDYVFINVADYLENRPDFAAIAEVDENYSNEQECEAYKKLFSEIVITCSVEFEDGTTAEKQMNLVAKTYEAHDETAEKAGYDYEAIGIFCELIGSKEENDTAEVSNDEIESSDETKYDATIESVDENNDADENSEVDETEVDNSTDLTVYGDTILVKEESWDNIKAAVEGKDIRKNVCEKKIKLDVSTPEFARWDWEPTEEDIMENVKEALGLMEGDTFEISFEYGDGRVYYKYTILKILD